MRILVAFIMVIAHMQGACRQQRKNLKQSIIGLFTQKAWRQQNARSGLVWSRSSHARSAGGGVTETLRAWLNSKKGLRYPRHPDISGRNSSDITLSTFISQGEKQAYSGPFCAGLPICGISFIASSRVSPSTGATVILCISYTNKRSSAPRV